MASLAVQAGASPTLMGAGTNHADGDSQRVGNSAEGAQSMKRCRTEAETMLRLEIAAD
jgi:hypothetical protein